MRIEYFVNNQLREFSNYNNKRMLPNIIDGLNITARKVIFASQSITDKMKVSQLGMRASGETHYKHGEDSIIDVVTGLAKSYPGANNMPLLEPLGQFGTRIDRKASSPRYIYTRLSPNFKKLFHKEDMDIITPLYEEGDEIEPMFYIPLLPTILINGAQGVGSGYSSFVFPYKMEDVRRAVAEVLTHGKVQTPLLPWLNGWTGTISKIGKQVVFTGIIKKVNTTTLRITELPPAFDLTGYKKVLNDLIEKKIIKDYDNNSTEAGWDFTITCPRETGNMAADKLLAAFKLIGRWTETFVCWGPDPVAPPMVFNSPEEIVAAWVPIRLEYYAKRKQNIIKKLSERILWAQQKSDFIDWWLKQDDIKSFTYKQIALAMMDEVKSVGHNNSDVAKRLMDLPMRSLTADERDALKAQIVELRTEHDTVYGTGEPVMMKADLGSIK